MKYFWLKSANGANRGTIMECTHERFMQILSTRKGKARHKLVMADDEGIILYNSGMLSWEDIDEIKGMMED